MEYNIYINSYEENTLLFKETTIGLLEDNFLTYNTDNDTIRINLNNFSFIKENVESILKITLQKCTLTLKEINQSLEIPIDYINYLNNNNKILLEYKLASQEKPIKIKIEIGEKHEI